MIGFLNGFPEIAVVKFHIRQLGRKRSVAAVIGPVCVQHTDLRHGRVAFFLLPEIILDVFEILEGHGQIQGSIQLLQCLILHLCKPVKNLHICGLIKYGDERIRLLQAGLSGIHRVDAVIFDLLKLLICQCSFYYIGDCSLDHRLLVFFQKLYALNSRICPLVELSRQEFHRKYIGAIFPRKMLLIKHIHRKLRKHGRTRSRKCLIADIFHIVADQLPHTGHGVDAEIAADLMLQFLRLYRKRCFFLHIYSSYAAHRYLL